VLTVLSIARSAGEEEVDISADFCACAVCEGTPLDILVVLGAKEKGVVKGVELQE